MNESGRRVDRPATGATRQHDNTYSGANRSCDGHALLTVPCGNNFGLSYSISVSSNPKTNEWNLLKEKFDALAHNEGLRQDNLEQFLDHAIRYRCGRFIAWTADPKTKANPGTPWPSDLRRANEVTPGCEKRLTRISRR
jgi:hypothetical protein